MKEKREQLRAQIAFHREKPGGIWTAIKKERKPRDLLYWHFVSHHFHSSKVSSIPSSIALASFSVHNESTMRPTRRKSPKQGRRKPYDANRCTPRWCPTRRIWLLFGLGWRSRYNDTDRSTHRFSRRDHSGQTFIIRFGIPLRRNLMRRSDEQLSAMVQVCASSLPPPSTVKYLWIYKYEDLQIDSQGDIKVIQWLEFLPPCSAVKDLDNALPLPCRGSLVAEWLMRCPSCRIFSSRASSHRHVPNWVIRCRGEDLAKWWF